MGKLIVEFKKGKERARDQKFRRMMEFRRSCKNKTVSEKNR